MKNLVKTIELLLINTSLTLLVIIVIHYLGLINIDLLFPSFLVWVSLTTSLSFLFIIKFWRLSVEHQKKFVKNVHTTFYVLLFFELVKLLLISSGKYVEIVNKLLEYRVSNLIYLLDLLFLILTAFLLVILSTKQDYQSASSIVFTQIPILSSIKNILHKFSQFLSKRYTFILILILFLSLLLYLQGVSRPFQMDEFFHAGVVKTFSETSELFKIGSENYGRSKLTSLLGISSYEIFNQLGFSSNLEFITRLPFIIFSVINVYLIFLIANRTTRNKILSLLSSLIVATETYIVYFSSYFRFYSISIFFFLSLLYLTISFKKITTLIKVAAIAVSFLLYYLLSEMFLLLALYFAVLLVIDIFNIRFSKKLKLLIIGGIGGLVVLGIGYVFFQRLTSDSNYNMVNWNLNVANMRYFFKWLDINYGLYFLIFLASIPLWVHKILTERKIERTRIIETYVLTVLLFIFVYMLNVPFNFTFRPALFFLPLLIMLAFKYLSKLVNKTILLLLMFVIAILNIYSSVQYAPNETGAEYNPTKLVYEKLDIVTGSKDIASYINTFFKDKDTKAYEISYIGLGISHIRHYLDPHIDPILRESFANTSQKTLGIEDFKDYTFNSEKNLLVILGASGIPRSNGIYTEIFRRSYISESPISIYYFIKNHPEVFKEVYSSDDNYSKIFLLEKR